MSGARLIPASGTVVMGAAVAALWIGGGCGRARDGAADAGGRASALTASGQRIIGFEAPTTDWRVVQGSVPPLQRSTNVTQGAAALALRARGFTVVQSAAFPVTVDVTGPLSLDFFLPTAQANPFWLGAVQLYVYCPSKSIFNAFIGQKELTGLPLGRYQTLRYDLPAPTAAQLRGGCGDLSFAVAVNVPSNAPGTYLLDNLRFGGSGAVRPVLECVAELKPGHFAALYGYESTATADVPLPVGDLNSVVPAPADRGQPRLFHPGRVREVAAFAFADRGITWNLGGSALSASSSDVRCSPQQVERLRRVRQAERGVAALRSIADPGRRTLASSLVLALMSSMNRVGRGQVSGPVEARLAAYLSGLAPTDRDFVARSGDGLPLIETSVRRELLPLAPALDPGDGSQPPAWDQILVAATVSNIPPRLRTDFCQQGDRSVTVGTVGGGVTEFDGPPDASARPTLLGIQRSSVKSPHPALIAAHIAGGVIVPGDGGVETVDGGGAVSDGDLPEGNGFSLQPVPTALPCPCDSTQGLICARDLQGTPPSSQDRCFAVPIVDQQSPFALRGYNFWDTETPILLMTPVGGGNPQVASYEGQTTGLGVAGSDCVGPNARTNLTHDTLSFSTLADEGFYRLQVANKNGEYHLRRDDPTSPGRVMHVCWRLPDGTPVPPEPGTHIDCDLTLLAGKTCVGDGAACDAGIWQTPPRTLAECFADATQPSPCGETPAYIKSPNQHDRVIFVRRGEARFGVRVLRQSVEAVEESGTDFLGSDETTIFLAANTDRNAQNGFRSLDDLRAHAGHAGPDDYDTGTRRVFNPPAKLADLVGLGQDEIISFGMLILEEDCASCIVAVVGALSAAITGGICFGNGPGPACTVSGAAGGALTAAVLAYVLTNDVDDDLGAASWRGTPRQIANRIAVTHDASFVPNYLAFHANPGALPVIDDVRDGELLARLMHPFVIDAEHTRVPHNFLSFAPSTLPENQCPGTPCTGGRSCLGNQCVAPTFQDATAGVAFREQRDILHGDDSYYGVDLLYERKLCVGPNHVPAPTETLCSAP